jgi:hypothetical protein
MNKQSGLYLDWCEHKAAKYAAEKWHYSGCLPASPTARIGVWENGEFIGAVTYSKGSNNNLASMFSLEPTEVCELTRVALKGHDNHVSKILSISRKLLQDRFEKMRVTVSYADPFQEHDGGVYKADNWYYLGQTEPSRRLVIDGESKHARSCYDKYGTSSLPKLKKRLGADRVQQEKREGKHRYAYPLDDEIKRKIKDMAQPYP